MNTITISKIAELVAEELRSYGFKCDGSATTITYNYGGGEYIRVNFGKERASGMAAFTQTEVEAEFVVWINKGVVSDKSAPWDLWNVVLSEAHPVDQNLMNAGVSVSVNYKHHGGGSNGLTRRFGVLFACGKDKKVKNLTPKLIDDEQLNWHLNKKSEENKAKNA